MSLEASGSAPDSVEFLRALGDRIRNLRAQRGMSRKMLADAADVSLRYLSDLENGSGNASVLLLRQVARALNVKIEDIVCEAQERSIDYGLLIETLNAVPEHQLAGARLALNAYLDPPHNALRRAHRIALIGLRGAGKSTIGRLLASSLQVGFVELSKDIEKHAGLSVGEIHSLYGQAVYRRHERQCLDQVISEYENIVLATPGSLVSEANTFNHLLTHFYTIWLQAEPEEHMSRVVEQGDMRPMIGNDEAMTDLKRILAGRSPFYAKADLTISTSGTTAQKLVAQIIEQLPAEYRVGAQL